MSTIIKRDTLEVKGAFDRIRTAQARREWQEVARLTANLRREHPSEPLGFEAGIAAFRQMRMFDEAENLLVLGTSLFPDRSSLIVEGVRNAHVKKDWQTTVLRAAELRRRFPTQPAGFESGITALRELKQIEEAEILLRDAGARFPERPSLMVQAIFNARAASNWEEAVKRAAALRDRFPTQPVGYEVAVEALCRLGRIDEAMTVAQSGELHISSKIVAERMRDTLLQARNFMELDGRLRVKSQSKPQDALAAIEYAVLPSTPSGQKISGGRKESVIRLKEVLSRFPETTDICIALGNELYLIGKFDEAEQFLLGFVPKLASSEKLAILWARVAEARNLPGEAKLRYGQVREWFPKLLMAHIGYVRSYVATLDGSIPATRAEVEAACTAAMLNFPSASDFPDLYARIAQIFGDHKVALDRWKQAMERFPLHHHFRTRVLDAELALGDVSRDLPVPETSSARSSRSAQGDEGKLDTATLLTLFCSLGSIVNGCEFGLVQRHFDAEPLGLFRWAGSPIEYLINSIEHNFEGLGSAEDTTIAVSGTGTDEYIIRSVRYLINFHTLIHTHRMSADACLAQMRRRLAFLAKKLREDLDTADCIFLYKTYRELVSSADLDRLYSALRKFGNHTLLSIQLADENHPDGSVELIRPGLMVGYVEYFHKSATNIEYPCQYDSWLLVCQRAHAIWDKLRRDSVESLVTPI